MKINFIRLDYPQFNDTFFTVCLPQVQNLTQICIVGYKSFCHETDQQSWTFLLLLSKLYRTRVTLGGSYVILAKSFSLNQSYSKKDESLVFVQMLEDSKLKFESYCKSIFSVASELFLR